MSKGKKSIVNAVVALLQLSVTSVLGLIFNRIILQSFGSTYNGINATITQIVNTIMIVEGGFTLASNVALFEPWLRKDEYIINGILAATQKRFAKIGWIALGLGGGVAVLYPFAVNGIMPYWTTVGLILTVLLPMCYNLGVTTKYRVIFLTEQKEYIISIISTVTYTLGILVAIGVLRLFECSLLVVRVIIMISLFVNYISLGLLCKYSYAFVSFKQKPLYEKIEGTKSVVVMKLTSIIYSSAPLITISLIPEKGAILASVYTVYSNIMSAISGVLYAIINAPRLSFGALFSEKEEAYVADAYAMYEMIMLIGVTIILGTTALMIMPFINIYTKGIEDANYYDVLLAVMLLGKYFVEIVHIPAGQMLLMSGNFEVSRKINIVACLVLMVVLLVGLYWGNIYVVVGAMLIAAIVLAVSEIYLTERIIVERNKTTFLKRIIPAVIIVLITCKIGMSNMVKCNGYMDFLGMCVICVVALSVVTFGVYYLLDKACIRKIVNFMKNSMIKG